MFRVAARIVVALLLVTSSARAEGPAPASVWACFTPGLLSCAQAIADRIDGAKSKVRVQAYLLTSTVILRSIVDAKRRGLDVEAILDKTQDRQNSSRSRYTGATYLANAGIPVWIDDAPAIAHNKILILDNRIVITGSFNFTKSADTRNAENVVAIESPEVASWFEQNWEARRTSSRAFEAE